MHVLYFADKSHRSGQCSLSILACIAYKTNSLFLLSYEMIQQQISVCQCHSLSQMNAVDVKDCQDGTACSSSGQDEGAHLMEA